MRYRSGTTRRGTYRDPGLKYPGPMYQGGPPPARPGRGGRVAAALAVLLLVAVVYLAARGAAAVQSAIHAGLAAVGAQASGTRLDVAGTAAGACVAYGPTGASKGRTIVLDPGHGGPDPGAMGHTPAGARVEEKQATLAVARLVESRLRSDGYRVVLSRTDDGLVANGLTGTSVDLAGERRDLQARVDCANAAWAAALLSIHFNGFESSAAGGTATFYDAARPFAAGNRALAQDVQSALVSALSLEDRGTLPDDELRTQTSGGDGAAYGHLFLLGPPRAGLVARPSAMPGALTEPLFVTQPSEAALVASDDGRQRVADAIASGLEAFLQKQ
jgi:N-acetylmuramoyl-L-alanine amidase